jgi:hypothetical protein
LSKAKLSMAKKIEWRWMEDMKYDGRKIIEK